MKKIFTTFIALITIATYSSGSYAKDLMLTYDGEVHKYQGSILKLKVNNELVETDIPPVIINNRSLVPARAVFEKLGAKVDWDPKNRKVIITMNSTSLQLKINDDKALVNNKTVKMEVPAKIINNRTMIPARFVGEQLNLIVGWDPDKRMVTIDSKQNANQESLGDIEIQKAGNKDRVIINVKSYKSYNIFQLANPDRLVVDIPYTGVETSRRITANNTVVKTIRCAQFEGTTARIVLDVDEQYKYSVEEKVGQLVLNLESVSTVSNNDNNVESASSSDGSLKIDCKTTGFGDEVSVNLSGYKSFEVSRLTDSDRIVVDISGFKISDEKEHNVDYRSSLLKSVRYSNLGSNSLRVVFDTSGQPQYEVTEKKGKLVFNVQKPSYRNIIYHNSGDRVYFTLGGAGLTEGGENLKKLYTERYDSSGRKYIITFASNLADLGSGIMNINDSLIDSVEINADSAKQQTSITFNAKDKYFYEIMARSNIDDTAITILKPASKRDSLVVIDPGHGGSETGAIFESLYEKNLNIDIAKRLNALLKKKNVKTYMMREDDSYVGLYERAYIANNLNAALFICIHNNALDNPNYGGTMTLYYPQRTSETGLTGKRFAQITQSKLLAKLGTTDRKIIERPDLVVLRATDMPAALAEIAFMTNKQDREKLLKDDFRQRAAEALCDSIIQALKESQ